MAIFFYRVNDPYGCFSNFSPHAFMTDGRYWTTSEHYFQANKFVGTERYEHIRLASSPTAAARMGRDRQYPLRPNWETVKDDVMREAVYLKFSSNQDILQVLLGTEGEELIEKTTDDYYWGCGTTAKGKNMLGKILMETRDKLRREVS
jgi:ribA/ribD-fused uncharacterized protein